MALNFGTEGSSSFRRRLAEMMAQGAVDSSPISSPWQGASRLAQALLVGLEARDEDSNKKAMTDWQKSFLTPGASEAPAGTPVSLAPPSMDATPAIAPSALARGLSGSDDVTGRIVQAESGGDPAAKNPRSSASGPGQFIDSTWLDVVKRNKPELAGRPDNELLAMRTDPKQAQLSREMTAAYARENNDRLDKAGLPVTPGSTYLSHFAGPGGAQRILTADPNAPVATVMSQQAITANPFLRNMTVGQIRQWADTKMAGGGGPVPAPPGGPRPFGYEGNTSQQPPGPPIQMAQAGGVPAIPGQAQAQMPPRPDELRGMPPRPVAPPAPRPMQPPDPLAGVPPQIRAAIEQGLNHSNPEIRRQAAAIGMQYALRPPEKPHFATVDGRVIAVDPRSLKSQDVTPPDGGFRPLVDPAERAKFGISPQDTKPYQIGPNGKIYTPPGGTSVSIDNRGENKFAEKAAGHQAERFNKIVEAGMDAHVMTADLQALKDIGTRITTGKTAEFKAAIGPYAEMFGVKIDDLDDAQAYKSIVAKLAPRMRVPGSGATSDYEMRQFLEALPGLGKTPGGNEIIGNTLQALAEHRMAAAEIASRAMAGEITPREAEKELRALPNPLEGWKKSRGTPATGAPAAGQPTPGVRSYNPATGKIE